MAEREFLLPDPGEGLTEAEVVRWLVSVGDDLELNQPMVEVETSKAVVEIPSPWAGRVVTLHASEGESVPVGSPLVTIDTPDGEGGEARPSAADPTRPHVGSTSPPNGSDDGTELRAAGTAAVRTTPVVRKLARDLGVDLTAVAPTGPEGRVTEDDVRGAAGGRATSVAGEEIALTPMRRLIAANLVKQAAIPQVTTFRMVECSALDDFRRELDVSPLPILIAALCRTIEAHPMLNASWGGDRLLVHRSVNVGIAVDTDRGLVVPVLRDAAAGGVADLADRIARIGDAARGGALTPDDLTGATIAVSNTGSYGSEAGTPLLAPGTAVTIALGVIAPRAIVVDGEVVARPACTLSVTFDHRVLDGATVGRAVTDLVERLQSSERLRDLRR
jgi:2-oxoisovalerate dehydrogenase E2 component (dihydrolipoyl transacylase)